MKVIKLDVDHIFAAVYNSKKDEIEKLSAAEMVVYKLACSLHGLSEIANNDDPPA